MNLECGSFFSLTNVGQAAEPKTLQDCAKSGQELVNYLLIKVMF